VPVRAVVVTLPGGALRSGLPPSRVARWALAGTRRALHAALTDAAEYLLRYRFRGWDAGPEHAATLSDTRWALAEVTRRHPNLPVVLVGNSLGGRAAIAAAEHPAVTGVVGIAPWLPPEQDVATLTGRPLLIIHGAADRSEAPAAWSLAFAERARASGISTARFVVPRAGHFLLRRRRDWARLTAAFAAGTTGVAPMPELLRHALGPGASLDLPLPVAHELTRRGTRPAAPA